MRSPAASILLLLLCQAFLVSCEQVRFLEIDEKDPRLVLNGIMSPEVGLWVNVSESTGATTPTASSFIPVVDAVVEIYQEDTLVESVTENDAGNYYTTDFHPSEGLPYEVEVNSTGMPPVRASVRIPPLVEIADLDTTVVRMPDRSGVGMYSPGEALFYTDIEFVDPPEIGNCYMIGAYYYENDQYFPLELELEDLDADIYILDGMNVIAYRDEGFNGERKTVRASFRLTKPEGFRTAILIQLYCIEEAYFDYMKSYAQNFTILNEDKILYEPVMVSSNVEDGYGIISAVSYSSVLFEYEF
jgi:hypothetical protein